MKSLVLTAPQTVELIDHHSADLLEIMEIKACGICKSDHKAWELPPTGFRMPRILGHEIAGVLSCDLPHLGISKGQRVVAWPAVSCNLCHFCQTGQHNLCPEVQIFGYHLDGGFAEKLLIEKSLLKRLHLFPVPTGLGLEEACLAEPLACVVNGLTKESGIIPRTALVLGAGFIGRLAARLIEQRWHSTVLVHDPNHKRLAAACRHHQPWCHELVDLVFVAASDHQALEIGLNHLAPGGTMLLFSGLPRGKDGDSLNIPHNRLHQREQSLVGAYGCTPASMAEALALMAEGLPVADLIGRRVGLAEVGSVLGGVRPTEELKVVVQFG